MLRNSKAYIIGNGPSRKNIEREKLDGLVYAANVRGIEAKPDYLHANDIWIQFDIIKSGYKGKCLFLNYTLIPIEIPFDMILNTEVPADYDRIIYNEEQKEGAIGWYFYCTDTLNNWSNTQIEHLDLKERRTYICYVPDNMDIESVKPIENEHTPGGAYLAPSGAYLLIRAIADGHDKLEMYGFDSMAGDFTSQSTLDNRGEPHGKIDDRFILWYKKIMKENEHVEFIWHTIKE